MTIQYFVTLKENGLRFDVACVQFLPKYSRNMLTQAIRKGYIQLNGLKVLPKKIVHTHDKIDVDQEFQAQIIQPSEWEGCQININKAYEDDQIIVINKHAGLVVHPGANHTDDTLANALIYQISEQNKLPRAGIVHRLDKDTTGLMVVAKTLQSYHGLVTQIKNRQIERIYNALIFGQIQPQSGSIDAPIKRSIRNRLKQAVHSNGKPAITHYKTMSTFNGFSHMEIKLDTGRTHQIRVHMLYVNHPIIGDSLYQKRMPLPKDLNPKIQENIQNFRRQALHAKKLSFKHPFNQKQMTFEIELPNDMKALLSVLKMRE